MDTDLQKRYRFFREHAGYVVGRRAAGALSLARAEQLLERATDAGTALVQWRYDEEPYDPGDVATDEEAAAKFDSNEWTGPFGCILWYGAELEPDPYDTNEETGDPTGTDGSSSLWGIVVGPRGTADPYCRTVAAELASELRAELEQALGDRLDAACPCGAEPAWTLEPATRAQCGCDA